VKKEGKRFFIEKKKQKTFATGGAGTGSAFNRHHRWRLKALPVPAPPVAKVFARFFQKALLS